MIQPMQVLLIVVVTVLTVLLTIIGVQVFFILKEIRHSVEKSNKILDDAGIVSGTVSKSATTLSNSFSGLASLGGILKLFAGKKKEAKEQVNE